jgi:pyrimidine and pyridine-specific 5'-nucleotidase
MSPNDMSSSSLPDDREVFFFDMHPSRPLTTHLDNCLYPKSTKIHDMMVIKIGQYFTKHLRITDAEAEKLHREYYQSYGLALEGLVRHHKIGNPPVAEAD